MRIVTCRSGVNGLPAAAPATASGSACGASRRWRRATARAVTRLGAIWGTHLWGGDGENHGKIMGKSWENLGRVYEHVHHIFIICSSYVHRFAPASCGRTPMVGFVFVSTIEVATAVGKWEQSIRLRTWEDPAKSESLHSQNLESTCNTAQC